MMPLIFRNAQKVKLTYFVFNVKMIIFQQQLKLRLGNLEFPVGSGNDFSKTIMRGNYISPE